MDIKKGSVWRSTVITQKVTVIGVNDDGSILLHYKQFGKNEILQGCINNFIDTFIQVYYY
jgi:hypothetical protein